MSKVVNCSWRHYKKSQIEFMKAGLRGVTLLFASGDSGVASMFSAKMRAVRGRTGFRSGCDCLDGLHNGDDVERAGEGGFDDQCEYGECRWYWHEIFGCDGKFWTNQKRIAIH